MKGEDTRFKSGTKAATECGRKGGRKSGESKRHKKAVREMMQEMLQRFDEGAQMTEQERLLCNQLRIAQGLVKGNATEAAKLVLKIAGEYIEQSELKVDAADTATAAIERVMKEINR